MLVWRIRPRLCGESVRIRNTFSKNRDASLWESGNKPKAQNSLDGWVSDYAAVAFIATCHTDMQQSPVPVPTLSRKKPIQGAGF